MSGPGVSRRSAAVSVAAGAAAALTSTAPWAAKVSSDAGAAGPGPGAGAGAPPILVLNSLDATVSVIDAVALREVRRLETGKEPHHLYLTPDEKSVIVANATSDSLTFIDPRTAEIQRTVRQIVDPYHLRFSPDMQWFVTAANRLNHVDIYRWQPQQAEPLALAKRIHAPKTPSHLMIDTRSTVVYATLQDSDELVAIDLASQTLRWKIALGKMPADLYLTADDRTLLIGMTGSDEVEVYDVSGPATQPARLVKRIKTGKGAHAFRARGDKRHVFVSNRVANTISLIDTQSLSVVDQVSAPGGPDCMELLTNQQTLLVTSRWARKLTFIDLASRKVVHQVPVGRSPHGVWTLAHAGRL